MSVINSTTNGQLILCKKCGLYHLEFGNLLFDFKEETLKRFKSYINSIDGDYYHSVNDHIANRRKIHLSTHLKGFKICLTLEELYELRNLLSEKKMIIPYSNTIKSGFRFCQN